MCKIEISVYPRGASQSQGRANAPSRPALKETLGLVAIECLFGCAESSILNYLMHSLASVNTCLTLYYFNGMFRIKIGDSAQPRNCSTSPTLFPMRGWGLGMRHVSSWWCSCSIMARTWRGIAESLDGGLTKLLLPAQSLLTGSSSSFVLRLAPLHRFLLLPSLFSSPSLCWYHSSLDR